jgi:hypothetical protein
MQKTHWKKLTNPDFIGAYALNPGEDLIVQIQKVTHETFKGIDGKMDEANIAHLVGHKPFILNATNQKSIEKALGSPYIEDWAGKWIQLYATPVKAFGETVTALRVRLQAPKPPERAKTSLTPDHPKWNEAKQAVKAGTVTIETIRAKYVLSDENEALMHMD